jgi:hypothetical protein
MSKQSRVGRIDGIQINYKVAKGTLIAFAKCPICGDPQDTSQKHPDIGQIVADRVNDHIKRSHPKESARYGARNAKSN